MFRQILSVAFAFALAGCATNNYQKAYDEHHRTMSAFREQAGPTMAAILEGEVEPEAGFLELEYIAKSTRPQDTDLQQTFAAAAKDFMRVRHGAMTVDEAATKFSLATEAWERSNQNKLLEAAQRDENAEHMLRTIGMYLAVGAQSLANSSSYQPSYVAPAPMPTYGYPAPIRYVRPYINSNGSITNGHLRTKANDWCFDNLNGCR